MMRTNFRLVCGSAMLCILSGAIAGAHHSHGNYTDTFIDLQGTVKEVHLINPHSWIYVDVKAANGESQTWSLEATSRVALERMGITPDFLKPGDPLKARCHPLRDG